MKCFELEAALRGYDIAPVYWVTGEESYLRDRAVALIKRAVLQSPEQKEGAGLLDSSAGGLDDFNSMVLYGDETDASEVLAAVLEVPVFSQRRLVILKSGEKLPARETEALVAYLKEPCETTILVWVTQKLDGRLKFAQALKDNAVVVDCSALADHQLESWIRTEAGRIGLRLNEPAVLLLKELADHSLSVILQELEKLASYMPAGAVAGSTEVELIRGAFPGASVFDLTDAIVGRDRGRALRILNRNLEAGEAPLRIFGSLVWQYRRLWRGKELLQEGRNNTELARALGISPYRLPGFLAQLRRFPPAHLRAAFALFLKTDSDLKGGSAGAATRVLESLLLQLCANLEGPSVAGPERPAGKQPPPAVPRPVIANRNIRTIRSGRPPAL
jgi:DNA polymerase-3 subunit delta